MREFFTKGFPQTFRRTWRYTAIAFLTFAAFAIAAYIGTWRDPEFSELAGVPAIARYIISTTKPHWWESVNNANQVQKIAASQAGTAMVQGTTYNTVYGGSQPFAMPPIQFSQRFMTPARYMFH